MNLQEAIAVITLSYERAVYSFEGLRRIEEVYRSPPGKGRPDQFLFFTVFEALWESLVVGVVAIWDNTGNVVSFRKLKDIAGKSAAKELSDYFKQHFDQHSPRSESLEKIEALRKQLIAHRAVRFMDLHQKGESITFEEFCKQVALRLEEVEAELDLIFLHLVNLDRLTGTNRYLTPWGKEIDNTKLKADARGEAVKAVGRWFLGAMLEERLQAELPGMLSKGPIPYDDIIRCLDGAAGEVVKLVAGLSIISPADGPSA